MHDAKLFISFDIMLQSLFFRKEKMRLLIHPLHSSFLSLSRNVNMEQA
jgi:hypothetical protein